MSSIFSRTILQLILLMTLSACATETKISKLSSSYPVKPEGCDIIIYKDSKPTEQCEILGKIESHIKRNFFFGGRVNLEDEGFQELRQKACELGGDAIIIDDYMESAVAEMTHVHVWATVVKFSAGTQK
jgi:hypothetical protein